MKPRAIVLFIMVAWVSYIMWCQTLSIECLASPPAFPIFFGLISADIFWTAFYTIAAIIAFTLIWGRQPATRSDIKKEIKKLEKSLIKETRNKKESKKEKEDIDFEINDSEDFKQFAEHTIEA